MSRGFFGGSGGGKKGSGRNKGIGGKLMSFKRHRSMKEMIADKNTHKVKDHKEMLEDLLDDKMFNPSRRGNFHLPGTVPPEEREMTKGYMRAMEAERNKKLKKKIKLRDKKVEIIPKGFNQGWLDKTGKIRDKQGNVILEINPNTGVITDKLGLKVGKYNPHSGVNEFKIDRLIDKYSKKSSVFNPFAPKDQN